MGAISEGCPSGDLALTAVDSCDGENLGFPVKLVLAKPTHAITVAGTVPTAAEFVTAKADTGADKAIVVSGLDRSGKLEIADNPEYGAEETADGLIESKQDTVMRCTSRLVLFDSTARGEVEALLPAQRFKCWIITNKNYCLGGDDGFTISNPFRPLVLPGRSAERPHYGIDFSFNYDYSFTNDIGSDADYDTL